MKNVEMTVEGNILIIKGYQRFLRSFFFNKKFDFQPYFQPVYIIL
jgi:hypothetical protein